MTPEERGADIFRKWNASPFVTKEVVLMWIENEKKTIAQELEHGFYQAEMAARVSGTVKKGEE